MATSTANVLNHQATDADHRTFAQGIHDLLIAVGLTQTADTGQANLATITRPGTSSVSGYEIFRFNDTEQATLGAYLKVEYGTSNSATIPGLKLTVGTGTNGAGTLTNSATAGGPYSWTNGADTLTQTRAAYASYSEGQLVLVFGQDLTNAGRGVVAYFGRPRVTDGSRTTDGLIFVHKYHDGSTRHHQVVLRSGGSGPAISGSGQKPPTQTTLVNSGHDYQLGADASLFPLPYAVNGAIRYASFFAYPSAAAAANSDQSVTVFGGARTIRTLGNMWVNDDVSYAVPFS